MLYEILNDTHYNHISIEESGFVNACYSGKSNLLFSRKFHTSMDSLDEPLCASSLPLDYPHLFHTLGN